MPILSPIGRKHPKVRLLIALIYLILCIGGLTMVYPFALMLAGSTKSGVDLRELRIVPSFLNNEEALYQKYVEGLFNESVELCRVTYDLDLRSFDQLTMPPPGHENALRDWRDFQRAEGVPEPAVMLGFVQANISRTTPQMLRTFKRNLILAYDRDVHRMNRELETDFVSWNALFVLPENFFTRLRTYTTDPFQDAYRDFKRQQADLFTYVTSVQGFYRRVYLPNRFGRDITAFNLLHGTAYPGYDAVTLSRRAPAAPETERRIWEQFVRETLNLLWIRVDPEATTAYQDFLRAKYGSVQALNHAYQTRFDQFDEIPLPPQRIVEPPWTSDWNLFIRGWQDPDTEQIHAVPLEMLAIDAPDFHFQDFLASRYPDIDQLNQAWNSTFQTFAQIGMPQQAVHRHLFAANQGLLRREFIWRNYQTVLDYLVFHGRGIANTAIYCTLAVLLALLVNPMAAYAMSRYRMPATYKILLFLLLTMAFPPIVTQIPAFLMLRDLNLLNTFAALVLPGMAHGYSIFLLKGFFDSLPRDLYESAEIDGANEWTMFWQISMSLSKPILAVIALNAFIQAYSNFMFALLICQDERMWTLMVWLYQLQMRSGQGVIYASLIVAAIPTFIIFFFCQQIILRGIVVPVEK